MKQILLLEMKKILLTMAAAAIALPIFAEGYQINTLSARQGGMGHTGVAQKLGAESMYFNPAGMAFMTEDVDITAAINAVVPTAKAKIDGAWYKTDNKVSTPMMINAGFSIYDNLKAGVSFYTPYGSAINWGENWPGAILNEQVSLKTFTIQPTVSWRIMKNLSVGVGLNMAWGSVNLDKGLVNPSTLDKILALQQQEYRFGHTMPASVNLTGKSEFGWGFNAGVMYDINDKVSVGVSYRSKMMMKVEKGDASLTYANDIARTILQNDLDLLNQSNFTAEMPMPSVLTFGVSYKPANRLLLALDAQFTGWGAYKTLDIEFLDDKLKAYDQHITKDYKNAWAFRVGAQYGVTDRFDARAGLVVDMTPVNDNHYNPETPGMTKLTPSVGFSFRPVEGLSIDFSLLYVAGLGANGVKCDYADLLAPKYNQVAQAIGLPTLPVVNTLSGDYKVHAFSPSLGFSYSF